MTGGLSLLLRMRIWAMLLLAAISLQALEPIRAPLERVPGSAWSSATSDLALASSRKSDDGVSDAAPLPPLRLHPAAAVHTAPALGRLALAPLMRPVAQAPPLA
ncbi:hypothetical protein MTR62_15460, partial [Novosphingobium sp. 1949]